MSNGGWSVTSFKYRIFWCKLQVLNIIYFDVDLSYKLQVTSYKLQVTSFIYHVFWCRFEFKLGLAMSSTWIQVLKCSNHKEEDWRSANGFLTFPIQTMINCTKPCALSKYSLQSTQVKSILKIFLGSPEIIEIVPEFLLNFFWLSKPRSCVTHFLSILYSFM